MAASSGDLLIRNAEIDGAAPLDARCRQGRIETIGRKIESVPGEAVLDAAGGALLPGLHDHHIHLPALAARDRSVPCGPPQVATREDLARALAQAPGDGWIRGVGYHESVAGLLDKRALDDLERHRPVRVQHRSGKMWFLNGAAAALLGASEPDGRLFRRDEWLRERLPRCDDLEADLKATARGLQRYGVVGVTETTPSNDAAAVARYRRLAPWLRVTAMGDDSLHKCTLKVMLDDAALPPFDALRDRVAAAHERGRPVAVHCATRTELVFALAALRGVGTIAGDRIEHASIADDAALALFADTRLAVVTQPHFIAERGDRYLRDVPPADHRFLYRCRGFLDAGIPLGGGTDAPFGDADPWAAMRAAVHRRTAGGVPIGADEALTPERALALFTTPPNAPGGAPRQVAPGAVADLCLLDRPWRSARKTLQADHVRATVLGGRIVQSP